jgi:DNA-binding Xre family transcriptional regulator
MMKLVVKEVAEREGIASAYELSKRTGIQVTSTYKIWNGEARMVGLDTLDRLCTVLGVKPGQLFEHRAEPRKLPGGVGAGKLRARTKSGLKRSRKS